MRLTELLREALASARAQKVPSAMVALLAAAMCLTTILTVGRTAAAEEQVIARIDAAGSRELIVTDAKNRGFLTSSLVALAANHSTVERAVGLTIAVDTTNARVGTGGTKVATWTVLGDLAGTVDLTAGRMPGPGEGLVSVAGMEALGLDAPVGAVMTSDGTQYPIVGSFTARPPFEDLDAGVVVAAEPSVPAQSLNVIVANAAAAQPTQNAILALLARPDPTDVTVRSPAALADVQQAVSGDLGAYGRSLLLLVLGAGTGLVAIVVLADVLLRRRDLGRRRALGAARATLVALVVLRTTLASVIGAAIGVTAAVMVALRIDALPAWDFIAATAVLAILAAAAASVGPATVAAHHDPVRVLRTP